MSASIDRLARWLLAAAARRWPSRWRAGLAREWAAELHAIGHEPGVAGGVRAWRQVRFASSLACARPARGFAAGRADVTVGLETAVVRVLALAGITMAAVLLALVALVAMWWAEEGQPRYAPALAACGYAVRVVAAVLMAALLARRVRQARLGRPSGLLRAAVLPAMPITAGAVAGDAVLRHMILSGAGARPAVAGLICGGVLLAPSAVAVAALARRGRRTACAVATLLGAASTVLAGTWAAVSLVGPPSTGATGRGWWLSAMLAIGGSEAFVPGPTPDGAALPAVVPLLAGTLVTMATVGMAYAAWTASAAPVANVPAAPASTGPASTGPAAAASTGPATPAVTGPATPAVTGPARPGPSTPGSGSTTGVGPGPWWQRLALAGGVFALLAWALTVTYLTPNIGIPTPWPAENPELVAGWPGWNTHEGRLWMHELRLFAILCAAVCLLFAGAYRGAPLLPAIAVAAALLAADAAILAAGWATPEALPPVAAAAIAAGVAAWWATLRLGRRDPRGHRHRRRLVAGATVLAAAVAPGIHLHRIVPVRGVQTPAVVLLVAVGLPTVLLVLAGMGAVAARARPLSATAAWAIPGGLGLASLIGGLMLWADGVSAFAGAAMPALAGPLVVLAATVIRGGPVVGSSPYLRTAAVAVVSVPVAAVVGYATIMLSMFSAPVLLAPIGYELGFDGLSYVPGAFVAALVTALVVAHGLHGPAGWAPAADTAVPVSPGPAPVAVPPGPAPVASGGP